METFVFVLPCLKSTKTWPFSGIFSIIASFYPPSNHGKESISVNWLSPQSKAPPAAVAPNHITSQFEKAKSFIQESLKTVPSAVSDLETLLRCQTFCLLGARHSVSSVPDTLSPLCQTLCLFCARHSVSSVPDTLSPLCQTLRLLCARHYVSSVPDTLSPLC